MQKNLCVYCREGKALFCVSVNGATSKHRAVKKQAFVVSIFLRKYLEINLTWKLNDSINFGSRIEIFLSRRKPL